MFNLLSIEKIRKAADEKLQTRGYSKTYLELSFSWLGMMIKIEAFNPDKGWKRIRRLIKFNEMESSIKNDEKYIKSYVEIMLKEF